MKPISLKRLAWWHLAILGLLVAWQFAKGNNPFEKLLQAGAMVAGPLIAFSLLANLIRWSTVTRIRTLRARLKHAESTQQPIRRFPFVFCVLAIAMSLVCCGTLAWGAITHGKEHIAYGALGTGSATVIYLIARVMKQYNLHNAILLISRLPPAENSENLFGLARDLSRPEPLPKPAFSKAKQAGRTSPKVVAQKGKDPAPKIPEEPSPAPEPKDGESADS